MFFLVVIDVMFCVEMCLQSIGSQSIFDNKSLLTLEDEEWRRIRVTITPTFSALKLKQVCVIFSWKAKKDILFSFIFFIFMKEQ